jgi:5-methylcytosine-specific restriction enzyme subunit McrC
MLAYAFGGLSFSDIVNADKEEFENIHSLFAEIILRGMNRQIKRGFQRDYKHKTETLSTIRGRIDISTSLASNSQIRKQLVCEFDEFTEDTIPNRIIKSAAILLIRKGELSREVRYRLKRLCDILSNVKNISPAKIRFDVLKNLKLNLDYKMLLNVCKLLFDGLLMNEQDGEYKLRKFLQDDKMHALFERFVREYFRYHYPEFNAAASQIPWDTEVDDPFLPTMKSDTTLSYGGKTLIIDTKYYSHSMSTFYGKSSYHSGNMYQIFSYVKNADKTNNGKLSGMLLYAKTDETIIPNSDNNFGGNIISVKTLDLTLPFEGIKKQLELIADNLKNH